MDLFARIVNSNLLVRRINLAANHVLDESSVKQDSVIKQLDLFTSYEDLQERQKAEEKQLERERRQQQAMLKIREKYGKNAILKGMNLQEGATARERNEQIGGHKA